MRPFLDPDSLHDALEAISKHTPLQESHPLLSFVLVQEALNAPEQLAGEHATLVAVAGVLRKVFVSLLGPRSDDPQADIQKDFRRDNSALQACSILYHRYLRSDVDWSVTEFAELVHLAPRSLQRRLRDGLGLLTDEIIEWEVTARRRSIEQVWWARIPFPPGRPLYNRESLLETAQFALPHESVLLFGISGIGKSSLAAALAYTVLPTVEDFYWIVPSPRMELLPQITEALSVEGIPGSYMLSYLTSHKVMLVIDGLWESHLNNEVQALFQRVPCICTAPHLLESWPGLVLEVPPLTRENAELFYKAVGGDNTVRHFSEVYDFSGGIPGTLREFAHRTTIWPSEIVFDTLRLHQEYRAIWKVIPEEAKWVWSLMSFSPPQGIQHAFLKRFISEDELIELTRQYILMQSSEAGTSYLLTSPALAVARFKNVEIELSADQLMALDSVAVQQWLMLLENGLWGALSDAARSPVLDALSLAVGQFGLWERWESWVNHVQEVTEKTLYWRLWGELEHQRLDRWRGHFATVMRTLPDYVDQAGSAGYFDLYARGLLELGLAALYQGNLAAAASAAQDAERVFERAGMVDMFIQARRLLARSLLAGEPSRALAVSQELMPYDPSVAELASEASLRLNQPEDAVKYALQSVRHTQAGTAPHGRALCALAAALRVQGALREALDYQQQAVNILANTTDIVGQARALNNLGVLYHDATQPERALELWGQALQLLLPIQDAAALQVIRANLKSVSDSPRLI